MSKHNRRRTRGGAKTSPARNGSSDIDSFELPPLSEPLEPDSPHRHAGRSVTHLHPRHSTLSASHWSNRYQAWQARERRQKEEREKLARERVWVFGGVSGVDDEGSGGEEDEELCGRMMEYFRGLDYLYVEL